MTQVPADAALLVIDVQVAFFRAKTPPLEGLTLLGRINQVIAKARKSNIPLFLVLHEEPAAGLEAFSERWQLDPDLHSQPGDPIIRKTTCDAFYGTRLEAELGARSIDTLLLAGYATEFCIDSTLRAALSKEFRVIVVSDAHTTNDSPVLKARLIRDFHNWAWANCTAARPVEVASVKELAFPELPRTGR